MKKVIFAVAIIALTGFSFISCKDEAKKETTQETTLETTTDEVAKVEYACPMKCEGDKTYTDKDVKCPVCGMDLKEVTHTEEH